MVEVPTRKQVRQRRSHELESALDLIDAAVSRVQDAALRAECEGAMDVLEDAASELAQLRERRTGQAEMLRRLTKAHLRMKEDFFSLLRRIGVSRSE